MNRWIIVACVLIVIGALAYAAYAFSRQQAPAPAVIESSRSYAVSFDASYDAGVHTIEGTVTLATPCESVEASATAIGGNIRVDLTVPPLEGRCLERATRHEFSVDVEAPEEAAVAVFVNGVSATIE